MAQMNTNEMEEFQVLSDRYQANLPGPLIGNKIPIANLATEFAQADPTYVVKTLSLAATHSSYRAVKGDGQCGWRGAVFSYYEILLQLGNIEVLQEELVRLQSFEDTMKMAGIDYDIMIDMFDYTWEVFDEIRQAILREEKDESILLNAFNDEIKSNSIVYHFKMMTSSYMQLHADQYEPFLEMPIHEYRVARVDPANQEIDQIGLQALTDGVIAPAGFALEVLYLDRSQGDEVTPHQFSPDLQGCPTIRLLYRPGHYDIIYRDNQQAMHVFLQTNDPIPQNMDMTYNVDGSTDLHDFLFPGGSAYQALGHESDQSHYIPHGGASNNQQRYYDNSTARQSYLLQNNLYDIPNQNTNPTPTSTSAYYQSMTTHPSSSRSVTISPPPNVLTSSIPITPPINISKSTPKVSKEPQIRLSAKCFNMQRHPSLPLDMGHHSGDSLPQAHFRNEDFQPQMWNVNEEYSTKQ